MNKPVIRFIGYGICLRSQISLEAIEGLVRSKRVLFFPTVLGEMERFLERLGVKDYEDLSPFYEDEAEDWENYVRIIEHIQAESIRFQDVSVLMPGHPRLGVSLISWLEHTDSVKNAFDIRVIPGLSSFDTIICDIGLDPLERGTILVDANRLLDSSHALDTHWNYLVYHVSSVGSGGVHRSAMLDQGGLEKLLELLLRSFPPDHEITLIESSPLKLESARLEHGALRRLPDFANRFNVGTTLFVPAM
jgi:uncharacterized protein YabN with tetrapyrrole methylase and pyrophosphatase domain